MKRKRLVKDSHPLRVSSDVFESYSSLFQITALLQNLDLFYCHFLCRKFQSVLVLSLRIWRIVRGFYFTQYVPEERAELQRLVKIVRKQFHAEHLLLQFSRWSLEESSND